MKKNLIILGILLLCPILLNSQQEEKDPDPEYTKVLIGRIDKFLPEIIDQESNAEKYIRVRDIIVQQYKDLSGIHDTRDRNVEAIRNMKQMDKTTINRKIDSVKLYSQVQLFELHAAYIGRLSSELTAEQVNMVKDGMTYGVLWHTYNAYLNLLPDLSDIQKRKIMAWLVEARELAMDKGSSGKKHQTFGKYKGKINNYLSKEGYDLKKAEQELKNKS